MRFRKPLGALVAGIATAALLVPGAGHAVDVPIVNPSFEDDLVPNPTGIVSGLPNGWSATADGPVGGAFYGSLHAAPTNYPLGAPDGTNVAIQYVNAGGTSGVAFGIRQVLTTTLEADTLYTLVAEVGNIDSGFNDLPNTPLDPGDDSFFDIRGYNGYRIELRVDDGGAGVLLAQDVDGPPAIADGEFQTRSLTFDSTGVEPALLGLPLEIRLVNRNLVDPSFPGSDRETNFDDVRLTAEPASVAVPIPPLASLCLGALLAATGGHRLSRRSRAGAPRRRRRERLVVCLVPLRDPDPRPGRATIPVSPSSFRSARCSFAPGSRAAPGGPTPGRATRPSP